MMTMPDAYDVAVAERLASLERLLSASGRLVERCLHELARERGTSVEVERLKLTGGT